MAEATGLRNNALPYPIYGAPFGIVFPMLDADGDLVTGASTPDAERSLNGDTFADCTNESTEIATNSGMYYLLLTAAEMTADVVTVIAKSATAGMKTTPIVLYPRKLVTIRAGTSASAGSSTSTIVLDGSASAVDDFYNGMVCVATIDGNVEARVISDYTGSNQTATVVPDWNVAPDNNDTFTILLPEGPQVHQANTTHISSTAQTARDIGASVLLSSGTGTGQVKLASGYVAPNWGDVGNPTTTLNLSGTTIKTATDVETDTADIQSRLPAALTGAGNIKADTLAVGGSTTVATNMIVVYSTDFATNYNTTSDRWAVDAVTIDGTSDDTYAGTVAAAVWDKALASHTTSGTSGERLGRVPNAAAGAAGGLPRVSDVSRIINPAIATVYYVGYGASDDTGAGTSPSTAKQTVAAALALAQDGDVVRMSEGTFTVAAQLTPAAGVTMIGAGRHLTVLDFDGMSNPSTKVALRIATRGIYKDFAVVAPLSSSVRFPMGVLATDSAATDVEIHRVYTQADEDGFIFNAGGTTATLYDCTSSTKFDCVAVQSSASFVRIFGGTFVTTGPSASSSGQQARAIACISDSTIECYNVTARASGGSLLNAGFYTGDNGAVMRIFGGSAIATGTGAGGLRYVLGNIHEFGCAYDSASGNGTLTRYPSGTDSLRISGDSTAADNLELFFDGTGYNASNSTVGTVSTVTSVSALANNSITAAALAADAVAEIWTTSLTEAYGTDGSAMTGAQLLYLILGNVGEFAISGTTKTVKKLDGSTTGATYTLDSSSSPTSITRSG